MNPKPTLLLADDDPALCDALSRGFAARGFVVRVAHTFAHASALIERETPDYAVVDLRLPGGEGLALLAALRARNAHARVVVLTGYGSIRTAVEAIKRGATYYLAKPASLDEIVAALDDANVAPPAASARPMSLSRLEWEHIQRVLHDYDGNISAAARALSMHRRTLQRKLAKHPTRS